MADVLSPSTTSPSPQRTPFDSTDGDALTLLPRRPQPRERIPSYAANRMSAYSSHSQRTSRSRPGSSATVFPAFQSSLSHTFVRDFAWPAFHPLHYGAPEGDVSGTSTPGSEWQGRRLSDPLESSQSGAAGSWSAGPWGGDGGVYGEPEQAEGGEALPSTSFGASGGVGGDDEGWEDGSGRRKHRKSKSYASISDYERGRRRESAGFRRSRASGEANDMFLFSGQQSDPAGRDSLRQSRGYSGPQHQHPLQQQLNENGPRNRADSHFATPLPNRPWPSNSTSINPPNPSVDLEEAMPLDSEPLRSIDPPQRQSIGPEDEELYAGRSLALYPFEPENSNELRLREGQVIMVSYRHGQGWLVAEDPETGEQGLVPEEYVRLLSELPHFDERTGTFWEGEEGEGDEEENGEDGEGEDEGSGGVDVSADTKVEDAAKEYRVDEAYQTAPVETAEIKADEDGKGNEANE